MERAHIRDGEGGEQGERGVHEGARAPVLRATETRLLATRLAGQRRARKHRLAQQGEWRRDAGGEALAVTRAHEAPKLLNGWRREGVVTDVQRRQSWVVTHEAQQQLTLGIAEAHSTHRHRGEPRGRCCIGERRQHTPAERPLCWCGRR
jgi:hypothetical protein